MTWHSVLLIGSQTHQDYADLCLALGACKAKFVGSHRFCCTPICFSASTIFVESELTPSVLEKQLKPHLPEYVELAVRYLNQSEWLQVASSYFVRP